MTWLEFSSGPSCGQETSTEGTFRATFETVMPLPTELPEFVDSRDRVPAVPRTGSLG